MIPVSDPWEDWESVLNEEEEEGEEWCLKSCLCFGIKDWGVEQEEAEEEEEEGFKYREVVLVALKFKFNAMFFSILVYNVLSVIVSKQGLSKVFHGVWGYNLVRHSK